MATAVDQVYRYLTPSRVGTLNGRPDLALATSGGLTPSGLATHPHFFEGFLGNAEQAATALLAVARVARTRYYVPPGMLAAILRAADPVVTSNGDRLRFESFSACCGVYARLDVLPEGLDGTVLERGTTNVDFNPPMREALAGIGGLDPLHLSVGQDVTVKTMEGTVTEEKVPLPERWIKGFAEVQVATSTATASWEVSAVEARRFIRGLPASSGTRTPLMWAASAGAGVRLTSRPGTGAVCLPGPERLRCLEPLLRFAKSLRAYEASGAPGAPRTSVWELQLDEARLVVALSPEVSRGFSGEGGILRDLADDDASADAALLHALLSFDARIDIPQLAREAGLDEERTRRALGHLGAAGKVGHDAHDGAYFHRELPFDPSVLGGMHPRLRDARALADAGAVCLDGDRARVASGDNEYVVRRADSGWRCSCPWYGKYQDNRGPCKHVLAVELVERG